MRLLSGRMAGTGGILVAMLLSMPLAHGERSVAPLVAADNAFAYGLLEQVSAGQPDANVFISPHLTALDLRLLATGSAGKTRAELLQVLRTPGLTANDLRAQCLAEVNELVRPDTNVTLTTATALWYRQTSTIRPEFLASSRELVTALFKPLDFQDAPAAEATINRWASDQTHGRIQGLADGFIDPEYTDLVLASAIYFKGTWADPFDRKLTKARAFHSAGGAEASVPMMEKSGSSGYREDISIDYTNAPDGSPSHRETKILQAVELPYRGTNLTMRVFLPGKGIAISNLLQILISPPPESAKNRQYFSTGFLDEEGRLVLPKFKLETTTELVRPLQAMGAKLAFDQKNADFSAAFGDSHYLAAVRQKAGVSIDEEGTEAAAVELDNSVGSSGLPFYMAVDRPFLIEIVDQRTGLILFLGIVNQL